MTEGRWVVDRIEGATAVLASDGGASDAWAPDPEAPGRGAPRRSGRGKGGGEGGGVVDVPVAELPVGLREGWVLVVPVGADGRPRWNEAKRDPAEEERRLREAREILDELGEGDEGGDVEL